MNLRGLITAALLVLALPASAQVTSLVEEVVAVCVRMGATPVHIPSEDAPEYCTCEARIWAKYGTEADLRGAMTFMTGDERYMKGAPYSYDDALDFIVAQSGRVEQACAG